LFLLCLQRIANEYESGVAKYQTDDTHDDTHFHHVVLLHHVGGESFTLCLPKGFSNTLATKASSPVFAAAMARTKPPMKSMMTGVGKRSHDAFVGKQCAYLFVKSVLQKG